MRQYIVQGRCVTDPPPADWRERLIARLGHRPRRLSNWIELALYGMLTCLDDAGETSLPDNARLVLSSQRGTAAATLQAIAQCKEGLTMPFTFLQTQPGQCVATLAATMGWCGNGSFIASTGLESLLQLAAAEEAAGLATGGLLIGWVDDVDVVRSQWLRLLPSSQTDVSCDKRDTCLSDSVRYVEVGADGVQCWT